MNKFRELRADEIDCRIAMIKDTGLSILLYKDARCDQNILDETVGPMNWMRHHSRDNANCVVSIWDSDKKMWVEKEDTGKESNTEAQKGLASDSFKRACFNWGIGRELYTAPFIWFRAEEANIKKIKDRLVCYDRFICREISYENGRIVSLVVENTDTRAVFSYSLHGKPEEKQHSTGEKAGQQKEKVSPDRKRILKEAGAMYGIDVEGWLKRNGRTWETLKEAEAISMIETIRKKYGDEA